MHSHLKKKKKKLYLNIKMFQKIISICVHIIINRIFLYCKTICIQRNLNFYCYPLL